jgi:hypothetical protein
MGSTLHPEEARIELCWPLGIVGEEKDLPAIAGALRAHSPRAMKTTLRWLVFALSFSRKKNLSTPYS